MKTGSLLSIEKLGFNTQELCEQRIKLYLYSSTICREISEEIKTLINFCVQDIRMYFLYCSYIDDDDVVIEYSNRIEPNILDDSLIYKFDETKKDSKIGYELLKKLKETKKVISIIVRRFV